VDIGKVNWAGLMIVLDCLGVVGGVCMLCTGRVVMAPEAILSLPRERPLFLIADLQAWMSVGAAATRSIRNGPLNRGKTTLDIAAIAWILELGSFHHFPAMGRFRPQFYPL
jgi:hypothetical protein